MVKILFLWQEWEPEVTAVDLSDKAIVEARILAEKCGVDVNFIESNVYDLPNVLEEKFDIILPVMA